MQINNPTTNNRFLPLN